MFPLQSFIRGCRRRLFRRKTADSTGLDLTGGRLLAAALVTRRLLVRTGVVNDEQAMIGVLLPPSVAAVIANASIGFCGKAAVNLNYTFTSDRVQQCLSQCAITHVVSSRAFLKRRPFEISSEIVCMEDLASQATVWDKTWCGALAYLLPAFLLDRLLGLNRTQADDLMAVLFTSGTTAAPKGVMLSHGNLAASIEAIRKIFRVERTDVVLGVLPFFHAFGYSATFWLPMTLDMAAVYHFDPFAAKAIGALSSKYQVTVLFATPTFLKLYQRRCGEDQFASLDLAITGAERLDKQLTQAFADKFGVTPVEGYGTTELSPWAAVNVPNHRSLSATKPTEKQGSVGPPVPGVQIKIVDPETHIAVANGEQGLLLVRGANVMLGYLNMPEKTAEVIRDGWYDTGDFATLGSDGFLAITGRQHRFSKIGGEMVPHAAVEDAISQLLNSTSHDDDRCVAVTATPDANKGERLIVLHTSLVDTSAPEIAKQLFDKGFPALWIPKPADFIEVNELPTTSLGKLDLGVLNQIAMDKSAENYAAHKTASGNS